MPCQQGCIKDLMHAMVMYMGHSPVMLLMVWTRTFDIVFATISCRPFFSVASDIVCHTYLTKQGPGSSHVNSPGGPTVTHVGHVWESTMHPPPPGQSKGLRPWEGTEDRPLSRFLSFDICAYVCVLYAITCILMYDYMLNPNSGATY